MSHEKIFVSFLSVKLESCFLVVTNLYKIQLFTYVNMPSVSTSISFTQSTWNISKHVLVFALWCFDGANHRLLLVSRRTQKSAAKAKPILTVHCIICCHADGRPRTVRSACFIVYVVPSRSRAAITWGLRLYNTCNT